MRRPRPIETCPPGLSPGPYGEDEESSDRVAAVLIAATRLYDALFYSPTGIDALPDHVKRAYGRLGGALRAAEKGSQRPGDTP